MHEPEPVVEPIPEAINVNEQHIEDDSKFLAEYEPEPIPCVKCGTPLTEVPSIGLVCANPECDPPVQEVLEEEEKENSETEENEILESVLETEKQAMKSWKHDNPDSSLKSQKRLFEKGVIKKLPWDDYLKPQEDFADEAAIEAAKWAQEQLEKSTEAYMENVDGHQVKKIIEGYQQNAEQNESTIWQRVKKAKE